MEQASGGIPTSAAGGLLALTSALSAASDPADILDVMSLSCRALLGADLVNISLLDDAGRNLRLVSSVNTPLPVAEEFATYSVDAPLPSRDALLTRMPVVLRSVADRDLLYPELAGVDVAQESFYVLPLVSGEPVGVLGLGWNRAEAMDDSVLSVGLAVADLCAAALHRALAAREEVRARQRAESALRGLRALQGVAAELAHTVDIDQAAMVVLASSIESLGAEAAVLCLLDDDAREATQVACVGIEQPEVGNGTVWRVSDSSLTQELLRTTLPVVTPSAAERKERFPDFDERGIDQEAWAHVLLSARGRSVGIASFGWRDQRDFGVEELALLQALADHLAAAVDRARLNSANATLLEERTRVAETLQRSLLPAPVPSWDGVVIAAGYEPADVGTEVCGDFYDVFEAHDGSLMVVIGDVAGRGVEAAGLTGMARHTLRALARDMSPPDALRRLNSELVHASRAGEGRLLTAAVVRLRRIEGGRVSADIALSGHCMPVLLSHRRARHVGTPGMILGATSDPAIGYETVELDVDDLLLLHTDGVIEARRHGTEFGEERLLKMLGALTDPEPAETVENVLSAVRWFRTTAPDDVAVVALRVSPPA